MSPSPHAWHSGSSRAPYTTAGTTQLHPARGHCFPSPHTMAGAGTRAVLAGAPCTGPGADRPDHHHHQLLGLSPDGLWSLCLSCCLCHASGLPCCCIPRDTGQHQDQTWGLRARTSHISSFAVQGQQPLFHEGKTLGLGSLQLSCLSCEAPVAPGNPWGCPGSCLATALLQPLQTSCICFT